MVVSESVLSTDNSKGHFPGLLGLLASCPQKCQEEMFGVFVQCFCRPNEFLFGSFIRNYLGIIHFLLSLKNSNYHFLSAVVLNILLRSFFLFLFTWTNRITVFKFKCLFSLMVI